MTPPRTVAVMLSCCSLTMALSLRQHELALWSFRSPAQWFMTRIEQQSQHRLPAAPICHYCSSHAGRQGYKGFGLRPLSRVVLAALNFRVNFVLDTTANQNDRFVEGTVAGKQSLRGGASLVRSVGLVSASIWVTKGHCAVARRHK